MMRNIQKRKKTAAALFCFVVLFCFRHSAVSAAMSREEILARIEDLNKKRNLVLDATKKARPLQKKHEQNELRIALLRSTQEETQATLRALEIQLASSRAKEQAALRSYGTVRRMLSNFIPTGWAELENGMTALKTMAQIKYHRYLAQRQFNEWVKVRDENGRITEKLYRIQNELTAQVPDPQKFLEESGNEVTRLLQELQARDLWAAKTGPDVPPKASGETARPEQGKTPETPKFLGNVRKKAGPDTKQAAQPKAPRFLDNVSKKPQPDSPSPKAAPAASSARDDYRIVSIAVETEPVRSGKETLRKLKNIDRVAIVIEIRGEQHIIDGQQAVSILVEKGMFRNFPGVGLVATTKYDGFGGYNQDYAQDDGKGKAPDDECGRKLSDCYARWGAELKGNKDFNKMSSDEYWGRVMCVQLEKRCRQKKQGASRDDDFDKRFKRTPMSEKDARIFGMGVLGDKKE